MLFLRKKNIDSTLASVPEPRQNCPKVSKLGSPDENCYPSKITEIQGVKPKQNVLQLCRRVEQVAARVLDAKEKQKSVPKQLTFRNSNRARFALCGALVCALSTFAQAAQTYHL